MAHALSLSVIAFRGTNFYMLLVFIGVGVSCRISYYIVSYLYLYISFSGLITSSGKERAIFLLSITCNYVCSVRRGFLFLLVLGIGYIILLWHSLCLPYKYFTCFGVSLCTVFIFYVSRSI